MLFFSVLDIVLFYVRSFHSSPVFASYEAAVHWDRGVCGRVSRRYDAPHPFCVLRVYVVLFLFLFLMSSFFLFQLFLLGASVSLSSKK